MIPLYTREAVRAIDRHAIEQQLVPGLILMENAGAGAAQHLCEHFRERLGRCVIVGGVGQNGGDAWVVARQLVTRGFKPRCVLVGDPAKVAGDARVNLDAVRALGIDFTVSDDPAGVLGSSGASLIVDGLFGTGLDRDLTGAYARAVEAINAAELPVFALDLPSGIDADTGQVRGVAVRAVFTSTFAAHKRGLHQYPGAAHAGEVACVPIGVPIALDLRCGLIEAADVGRALGQRAADAHKGTNGRVVVFAGSIGKTGAAVLSSQSALRGGAGLVTIATDVETQRALDPKVLEVMTAAFSSSASLRSALALAHNQNAALLGPGFGLDGHKTALARDLARELPIPCVIDADALTAIGRDLALLTEAHGPRVLTPHPGEASRLLGRSIPEIEADRYESARLLAAQSGQVAVLKGARTVIASPTGELRVCRDGTPALGTAGTGDVLGGLIASLCAEHEPFTAAWMGVELHALAGRLASASDRGTLASEVARALPRAFELVRTP